MERFKWTLSLLLLFALLLSACRPIVAPDELSGLNTALQSGAVMGDVEFAVSDWGLAEGWIHFETISVHTKG